MANPSKEKEFFARASEIDDPQARADFLDIACDGDAKLRERIDFLLQCQSADDDDSFLRPAEIGLSTVKQSAPEIPSLEDQQIGNYKVLQKIGEGGFGIVYMAEQLRPVKRRVALKIIKIGMDTKEMVNRFQAERQALAMMDHPGIAKVFDAGATETGRPYFVMELVRGIPITDYCDQHRMAIRERLELFAEVCLAVHHAHQKGIIHRDLKPSNVMVTSADNKVTPKVIDFGIAKAMHQPLTDQTVVTLYQQFVGTPVYMSPEQAQFGGLDIDTRSDIYSLGVLLYQLLTGATPFDGGSLLNAGIEEFQRSIRENEPPKPSTLVSTIACTDSRRFGLDRDEGDGERPHAPL
jgi:serine/threonine protein kinase